MRRLLTEQACGWLARAGGLVAGVALLGAVLVAGSETAWRVGLVIGALGTAAMLAGAVGGAVLGRRAEDDLAVAALSRIRRTGSMLEDRLRRVKVSRWVGGAFRPAELYEEDPPVVLGSLAETPTYAPVFVKETSRIPSHLYKVAEWRRRMWLLREEGAGFDIMRHNSKEAGYQVAERCGVSVPITYVDRQDFRTVDLDAAPDRFVLKPCGGSNGRGVRLLVRQPDGRFRDLLGGELWTADRVLTEHGLLVEQGHATEEVLLEELLAPRPSLAGEIAIPDDLKVWCFEDRPAIVMQRRMHGTAVTSEWTFKFWSAQWEDLGPVKHRERIDPGIAMPEGGAEVVAAASRMGGELDVPFVRLDLFDTDRGVVFGEISPVPGPPEIWRSDVDEMLGREWEIAEARKMAAGRSWVYPRS